MGPCTNKKVQHVTNHHHHHIDSRFSEHGDGGGGGGSGRLTTARGWADLRRVLKVRKVWRHVSEVAARMYIERNTCHTDEIH
jgi:hypothetical protein